MVIIRSDRVINIFEMKYYKEEFVPTSEFENDIMKKIHDIEKETKNKYQIMPVFVSMNGIKKNAYSGIFFNFITYDDLFDN